ncbi:Spermatogenesis-associated protein 20 [Tolypocladium paradoxum]|uniref:Spermatogenesis-associated protein 20 n=1 Tax=Tolypocladium paradoxum TaxID=94208 RepID=A0A2S4L7F6_9HYPO|nr:Spermatogenesis-associated protein 20 [Tolypocladium paradoxum]
MAVSELTASAVARGPIAVDGGVGGGGGAPSQLPPLQNRSSSSQSPFARGAQSSPVKWQLLDCDSVERAKRENKLIFLHVGFKACHFCRLMALESFSNPECASILNESFVPVIVDREERPDIDTIYMNYVQAVSNVGGWPLNLFVTPELEPVFGGTYWPGPGTTRRAIAEHEEESPDCLTILKKVRDIWRDQEARCRKEATEVLHQLREFAAEGTLGTRGITSVPPLAPPGWATPAPMQPAAARDKDAPVSSELDLDQLDEAYTHIAGTFDPVYGGFGLAPKFLTPPKLAFLLQLSKYPSAVQDVVGEGECKHSTEMAVDTLRRIRDGALRDHVGGKGFARCSVTPDWSIPNFEKLVVDNAVLLSLYLEAWQMSGAKADGEFHDVVNELAEYLTSAPIALPEGGFASSEAADSHFRRGDRDMREGAYYLWTRREFDSVLDAVDKHISPVVAAHWDVQEDGNVDEDHDPNDDFINHNILRVVRTSEELSKQFSIPVETVQRYIQAAKKELKARRERERVRPELDDKVVTGWNGLVVSALARTAAGLKEVSPDKADKALNAAKAAVSFVKKNLWDESAKVLYRIWKDGRGTEGFADDYAYLVLGLLDLFDATGDESLLEFADTLQKTQITLFHDPAGAFYSTTASSPHTILRLKDGMDTSLPSTNAVSVSNLFRLGALLDDERFHALARGTVNAFEAEMLQHPWLFPGLLAGVVTARLGADAGGVQLGYKETRDKA